LDRCYDHNPLLKENEMEESLKALLNAQAAAQALATLRGLGWKVIAFPPELVDGVDGAAWETASVEAYWQVLEDIGRDEEAAIALE
jgi:hypothetical protein